MKEEEIRNIIENLTGDIDFFYKGKRSSICPFNKNNISVCYGDAVKGYSDVEDVMKDLFWEGKSLKEVCHEFKTVWE